jgi:hypothetical protein
VRASHFPRVRKARYPGSIALVLDVETRRVEPPIPRLTAKQFFFLLKLAVARAQVRTSGVGDEWVAAGGFRQVPFWYRQPALSVGKTVSRLAYTTEWFAELVEFATPITRGPYRLRVDAELRPGLHGALAVLHGERMPPRLRHASRLRRRRLDPTELDAYDLLVQYGVYLAPIVALIRSRIGDPAKITEPDARLTAIRILVTLDKNQGRTADARARATEGLEFARRRGRRDDVAYLLDQIGGTYHIDGDDRRARQTFEEEIAFLKSWGGTRAEFHLVGAYRGLASVLRVLGDEAGAGAAIEESRRYAARSGNAEGLRLADIEATRLGTASPSELLASQPATHVIARLMAMREAALRLLAGGEQDLGARLLRHAHADAERLGLRHEQDQLRRIAQQFSVALGDPADRPSDAADRSDS